MNLLSGSTRVWAYPAPCDLRRGYNGLFGLARNQLGLDPLSGDLVLFVNRRRNATKILLHDGTGLCIFMKRLDRGRFAPLWRRDEEGRVRLSQSELGLYLEGCQEVGYRVLSPAGRETERT
jgi:transposase